jgi:hypothetical protein
MGALAVVKGFDGACSDLAGLQIYESKKTKIMNLKPSKAKLLNL